MNSTLELEALYSELDTRPDDHTLLSAIADWHLEQETGLGLGFRACVECGRVPWFWAGVTARDWGWFRTKWSEFNTRDTSRSQLPTDWLLGILGIRFEHLEPKVTAMVVTNLGSETEGAHKAYIAAAEAFNLLTPDQQTKLLAGELDLGSH